MKGWQVLEVILSITFILLSFPLVGSVDEVGGLKSTVCDFQVLLLSC